MNTEKTLKLYKTSTTGMPRRFPDANSMITSFKYSAKRMGNAPTISATFFYRECLDGQWSDDVYAIFNREKYRLKNTPSSSYDNTSCMYKHSLEFVSERIVLENVYFFDIVSSADADEDPKSNNSSFMFAGGLSEFAERFNRSAKWSGIDYRVVVDDGVTADEKPLEFQDQFLYNALKTAYDAFDVPFYFKGTGIHFGYAENVIKRPLRYGVDDALMSISRNNTGAQIINRITGVGSDRNITYYYPNPTPNGTLNANVTSGNFTINVTDQKKFGRKTQVETPVNYISPFPVNSHVTGVRGLDAYGMTSEDFSGYDPANGCFDGLHINFQLKMDVAVLYPVDLGVNLKLNYPENPGMQDAYSIFFEENPSSEFFANTYIESSLGSIYKPKIFNKLSCGFGTIPSGQYSLYISIHNNKYGTNLTGKRWYPTITADANWVDSSANRAIYSSDSGFEVVGGAPRIGDSFTPNIESRINVQQNLMPPKYRNTGGLERFYNAENHTYYDKDGNPIIFDNQYSETRPRENIFRDDEIYPSITGMINASGEFIDEVLDVAYDRDDDDEIYPEGDKNAGKYKHPYFFVKLRKLDGEHGFNLFEHAIENNPMTISMTTGTCGACEFTIGVNDNNKNTVQVDENGDLLRDDDGNVRCSRPGMPVETPQPPQNDTVNNEVWVALKKDVDTYGVIMPNVANNQYVKIGDKFVILHIDLPESYVLAAEKRLEDALIKHMADNNSEKYTYSVKFSRIFFEDNADVAPLINENAVVNLEYNYIRRELFVTSFSYNMSDNSPLPEITVELEEKITIKENFTEQLREQTSNSLKPQLSAVSKKIKDSTYAIQTLQNSVSDTNTSNQLVIEDIIERLEVVEENTGSADLTELKQQLEELSDNVDDFKADLDYKLSLPKQQPWDSEILAWDSDNATAKGLGKYISATIEDIEHAEQDSIPTCHQVYEYISQTINSGGVNPNIDSRNLLNIKPTVRMFFTSKQYPILENAKIYFNHPYMEKTGEGEFILMRHNRSRKKGEIRKANGEWSVCVGAKAVGNTDIELKYGTTPLTLQAGWTTYKEVLEQICARAMWFHDIFPDCPKMHMGQAMVYDNSKALNLLSNYYYSLANPEPWKLFGKGHDTVRLGIALRVKNPEFLELWPDETALESRVWDTAGKGYPIPKYLYSSVTELILSAGSKTTEFPKLKIMD